MRRAILLTVAALVVCAWLAIGVASAQVEDEIVILGGEDEKPVVEAKYVADEVEIGVGGILLFRIRASAVGYTPAQRARIVNARLVYTLSYGCVKPECVHVAPVRGLPTVYIGKVRLISVYPGDAEAAGAESSEWLANVWAAAVACSLPSLVPYVRIAE